MPPARGRGRGQVTGRGGRTPTRGASSASSSQGGGRGTVQAGGGRGTVQTSGGKRAQCYVFPGRPEVEASDAVITCISLVCHRPASLLFDSGSTFSYVSAYFTSGFDLACDHIFVPISVSTPLCDPLVVD